MSDEVLVYGRLQKGEPDANRLELLLCTSPSSLRVSARNRQEYRSCNVCRTCVFSSISISISISINISILYHISSIIYIIKILSQFVVSSCVPGEAR
jgi:hypothetical protein